MCHSFDVSVLQRGLKCSYSEAGISFRSRIPLKKKRSHYHILWSILTNCSKPKIPSMVLRSHPDVMSSDQEWACMYCFLIICTYITPELSSCSSCARFTSMSWLTLSKKEKLAYWCAKICLASTRGWDTYYLPTRSFISWLTLLTTVSSAATRSIVALLSSLTLWKSGTTLCQWRTPLRLAEVRRRGIYMLPKVLLAQDS